MIDETPVVIVQPQGYVVVVESTEDNVILVQEPVAVVAVTAPGPQGPPGLTGPSGAGATIRETPIGEINGVNTLFRASEPFSPGSMQVFLNGLLLEPGDDYAEVELTDVSFFDPPLDGDRVTFVFSAVG